MKKTYILDTNMLSMIRTPVSFEDNSIVYRFPYSEIISKNAARCRQKCPQCRKLDGLSLRGGWRKG